MTTAELVLYLRSRTGDTSLAAPIYEDSVYESAIDFALSKLSNDLGEHYLTPDDVPQDKLFLLQKLATIEMYYVFAASSVPGSSNALFRVEVPDLEIEMSSGAEVWINLAKALQDEYDGELGRLIDDGGTTASAPTSVSVTRVSRRTGTWVEPSLALPISAPVCAVIGMVGAALFSWTATRDEVFVGYELYRADSAAALAHPEEDHKIMSESHPDGPRHGGIRHTYFQDESLAAGSWFYRLAVLNRDDQRGWGAIKEVIVL